MKPQAKHTPGPLQVRRNDDGYIVVAESHRVAQLGSDSTAKANARLIAAAPELLMQLQSLINTWDYAKSGKAKFVLDDESIDIIRETVRKATGGAE